MLSDVANLGLTAGYATSGADVVGTGLLHVLFFFFVFLFLIVLDAGSSSDSDSDDDEAVTSSALLRWGGGTSSTMAAGISARSSTVQLVATGGSSFL